MGLQGSPSQRDWVNTLGFLSRSQKCRVLEEKLKTEKTLTKDQINPRVDRGDLLVFHLSSKKHTKPSWKEDNYLESINIHI